MELILILILEVCLFIKQSFKSGPGSSCFLLTFQSKGEVQEKEIKKFDGSGYDKDLVEALERDIISQNPNVKWWVLCCRSSSAVGLTPYKLIIMFDSSCVSLFTL